MASTDRKAFLDGTMSFEQFYRAVNETAGFKITDKALIARCRAALDNEDYHLNSIPLSFWDGLAGRERTSLPRAFREHGDYPTLAGLVCAIKQAARDAAFNS